MGSYFKNGDAGDGSNSQDGTLWGHYISLSLLGSEMSRSRLVFGPDVLIAVMILMTLISHVTMFGFRTIPVLTTSN